MINQKKFEITALALEKEIFVIHIIYLKSKISIYPAQKA